MTSFAREWNAALALVAAAVIAFLASGKARHATGTTVDVNSASYVR